MAAPADPSTDFPAYQLAQSIIPFLGGSDPLAIHVDNPDEIHQITTATPVAADVIPFEDASDSWNKKSTTIGAIPIAQAQVAAVARLVASDAAIAIAVTDRAILAAVADADVTVTGSGYSGQEVTIRATVTGSGTIVVPCTKDGVAGNSTLTATGDYVSLVRISTAWHVVTDRVTP